MRRTRLFCAIGVSLWSAVVTGSQAAPTGALSESLRVHVKNERLEIVTSIRGLPLGVRDGLQTLFGSQAAEAGIVAGFVPFNRTPLTDPRNASIFPSDARQSSLALPQSILAWPDWRSRTSTSRA